MLEVADDFSCFGVIEPACSVAASLSFTGHVLPENGPVRLVQFCEDGQFPVVEGAVEPLGDVWVATIMFVEENGGIGVAGGGLEGEVGGAFLVVEVASADLVVVEAGILCDFPEGVV